MGEAYYRPGADFISLPRFEAFKSAATFYATAFHELGHATGHKSRLDRDLRSLCVPKSLSALISRRNHLTSVDNVLTVLLRPGCFGLAIPVSYTHLTLPTKRI